MPSTDAQPVNADSGHASAIGGTAILLGILGGMTIAALFAAFPFLYKMLLEPFSVTSLGTRGVDPPLCGHLLALLAAAGYVFNVFRQVHGMAIVCSDETYQVEVDKNLKWLHRLTAIIGLLVVVGTPALLAALMTELSLPDGQRRLDFLLHFFHVEPASGPIVVLAAYVLTMFFYLVWDYTALKATSSQLPHTVNCDASSYSAYIGNWLLISVCVVLLAVLVVVLAALASFFGLITPSQFKGDGRTFVVIIALVTIAYSLTDYYINRHFYFGNDPSEDSG